MVTFFSSQYSRRLNLPYSGQSKQRDWKHPQWPKCVYYLRFKATVPLTLMSAISSWFQVLTYFARICRKIDFFIKACVSLCVWSMFMVKNLWTYTLETWFAYQLKSIENILNGKNVPILSAFKTNYTLASHIWHFSLA